MKRITPHFDRSSGRLETDYEASYDGNVIGFYPTHHTAEIALDDYVLDLCAQGLIDQPLAALIPSADWGAYANGSIYTCGCGKPAYMLLHGVHDTLDIALCVGCHAAYEAADPEGDEVPVDNPDVDSTPGTYGPNPGAQLEWYAAKDHVEANGHPRRLDGLSIAREVHRDYHRFVRRIASLDEHTLTQRASAYTSYLNARLPKQREPIDARHIVFVWRLAVAKYGVRP